MVPISFFSLLVILLALPFTRRAEEETQHRIIYLGRKENSILKRVRELDQKEERSDIPDDFNFALKYGVKGKNILNTFEGTFTKDLIRAGEITTDLRLTRNEMVAIYEQMQTLKLWDYPEVFPPLHIRGFRTPNPIYHFKIQAEGEEKRIFSDGSIYGVYEAEDFRDLIKNIIELIFEKEEYKKLPEADGGYF